MIVPARSRGPELLDWLAPKISDVPFLPRSSPFFPVRGYRNQHHVESAFRDMKNPYHLCLRPQRHWTDQKMAVHVFYCVLALTLCTLLRRELHRQGIDRSIEAMLEQLSQIREVAVVYPPRTKGQQPILEMTTSQMSENQRLLYDALGLKRYLAG